MNKNLDLSLVIPCFNESMNLPFLIEKCKSFDHKKHEIILVDNGSSDNTHEVIKNICKKYPFCRTIRIEKNIGYGNGIIQGLKISNGKVLSWTHADMQTNPEDVLRGLNFFNDKDEIFVKGKRIKRNLVDSFFTFGMSIFETILLRKIMFDINAQPTMFKKSFLDMWINPPNDFALDLYAYYLAKSNGLKIKKFNVYFENRLYGKSHWNINFKSKVKFILRTIKFSLTLKKGIK